MKSHAVMLRVVCLSCLALVASRAPAQTLYSQNFDVNDQSGLWNINRTKTTDNPNFFFDYSTVGIPSAPNSAGGSTLGMKLQANIATPGAVGGVSVSPTGKSFVGDYALRFDLWSNFIGAEEGSTTTALTDGLWEGGSSSTKFSNYGILSNGTGSNWQTASTAGSFEALAFGATGDGQTTYDYHVHGPGARGGQGFRGTTEAAYNAAMDAGVTFGDAYPVGHPLAGQTNRAVTLDPTQPFDANNTAITDGFLYQAAFPSVAAPGQAAIGSYGSTQFDTTMPGAMGMAWRRVEVKKLGNIVTWAVLNGGAAQNQKFVFATVDLSLLQTPATSGTNIFFGEADPTSNVGSDPNFAALQFTLIDNISVERLDPNFNDDNDVDNDDLAIWANKFGLAATATTGDANGDGLADGADFLMWQRQYTGPLAVVSVPEPAAGLLGLVALVGVATARRRRAV